MQVLLTAVAQVAAAVSGFFWPYLLSPRPLKTQLDFQKTGFSSDFLSGPGQHSGFP